MKSHSFIVEGKKDIDLEKISCDPSGDFDKKSLKELLQKNVEQLKEIQSRLYAENQWGVLVIFQAMDTAGKDDAIKHVMTGFNPQGTQVKSFKQPSSEELDHDYLWRAHKYMPERGNIGIFNRSYYEEVLVVKVHNLLKKQSLPSSTITDDVWKQRYRQINDFEKYLLENGILTVKIFLHITKEEQKNRLLSRIDDESKNWKFAELDIAERKYWDKYQKAYAECIKYTSTKESPWFVVPANNKWYARAAVSEILSEVLNYLNPQYPMLSKEQLDKLDLYKAQLLQE
ncbi:MAG: polyphosphate kinase 2 family protein [Breznakibacter sp.]|nr:polyphosphate kinase 2 family protein [Breznakibacter sp.]